MTRKRARIGLVIWLLLWSGAHQQIARVQGPIGFDNLPIEAFFLYFGPLIALVLLVLSLVGRRRAGYGHLTDHERAARLANLGATLCEQGRLADAFQAESEAVGVFRKLAKGAPDRYRPDLALTLSNLGITLSHLDNPDGALAVEQEATAIRRELASSDPDARSYLADSLSNLANYLSKLDRHEEAQQAEGEAKSLREPDS